MSTNLTTNTSNFIPQAPAIQQAPAVQQDSAITKIPTEMLFEILKRVHTQDVVAFRQVCRSFNTEFSENSNLWKTFLKFRFPEKFNKDSTNVQNFYACKNHYFRYNNILRAIFAERTSKSTRSFLNSCLLISGGKIYTAPKDSNIIEIHDVDDLKHPSVRLRGHTDQVCSVAIENDKLYSASLDETIKVWDLYTNTLLNTLPIGQVPDCLIPYNGKLIISGSKTKLIEIWDLEKNTFIASLNKNNYGDSPVLIKNNKLYCNCIRPDCIKIFDLDTNTLIDTLDGYDGNITSFVIENDNFITEELVDHYRSDKTITKVWDLHSHSLMATWTNAFENPLYKSFHTSFIENGKLISAYHTGEFRAWDLETKTCISKSRFEAPLLEHSKKIFENGKLISITTDGIRVLDFNADHNVIFGELAVLVESKNSKSKEAIDRFSRMPERSRNEICGELFKILKLDLTDATNRANLEQAFKSKDINKFCLPEQFAQAIRNCLQQEQDNQKDSYPLLQHLGIVSSYDYSTKLGCKPDDLPRIGIFSLDDLKCICSPPLDLQELMIIEDTEQTWDFRDNAVKSEADRRKEAISELSKQMVDIVLKRREEINSCGGILYATEWSWIDFQNRLNVFQAKFERIAKECNDARTTVAAFKAEKYNELAVELLNALIKELQLLDHSYQLAKLHAYIDQKNIVKTWQRRNAEGMLNSIEDLPDSERTLKNLLSMGR
jgi:WD40 repeat protein